MDNNNKIMVTKMNLGEEELCIGLPVDIFESVDSYIENNSNKRISIKSILEKYSDKSFIEYRENMFGDFIWMK